MKKKILATVLAAMVAFSVPMSASAAWRKDSTGNWQWWENGKKQIGWKYVDNSWYYFNVSGTMQTGWLEKWNIWGDIDNEWEYYYFNSSGHMTTGWQFISNKWYYFGTDGKMQTGWQFLNDNWYYFDKDGAMHTGWLKESVYPYDENKKCEWYYLLSDGKMVKGWQTIDGNRYYFRSDGKMEKDTIVDGYSLDATGLASWIERKSENDSKVYSSIDDLIAKWNREYCKVSTPCGDVKLTFTYHENTYSIMAFDYDINTEWDGLSLYDVAYSVQYTESQKTETKKILKRIQENVAMDVFQYLPGKKVQGGYHMGFYKYPHIRVDYVSIDFLSWQNYTELSWLDPASSVDRTYQNSKVDQLHWNKYLDTADLH